jgi:hypothetical protein
MKSSFIEWITIFVAISFIVMCLFLFVCGISFIIGSGSQHQPRTYTVKTQDESYSGLRYDYSHEGKAIFLDKDNKKHVFSGNFQYVEE